jgi:hypothetical protein
MAEADERAVILAYHEATKQSPVSVRARAHYLDWDNRPFSFKVYPDLERIPLPGVWPGATTFVTVGATDSSINLITAGVNSNGTASWTRG